MPPRDPEALAQAIGRLIAEPDEARRLAAAAKADLGERSIDAVADRFGRLYEEVAETRAGR